MTVLFHATPSLREERLPGGAHTSLILRKGQILRLTDIDGWGERQHDDAQPP
ncbi:uncharacterized protein YcgI (DUF1989 family) [Klebsiella variicola]|nr:uncharacterized protein YcgI (DUF1989 family) [Klebsiella variicola]